MPPRLALVRASDEEKRARDALTHAEWGTRLTPEQYFERERRLRAHPWAREAMTTWLLVEEAPQDASPVGSGNHPAESGLREHPAHRGGAPERLAPVEPSTQSGTRDAVREGAQRSGGPLERAASAPRPLEASRVVLGSCETFRMQSVLRVGGGTEVGDAYGVASVFVEPRLRGRGFATQMMTALVSKLRSEPGRPHSTILFSDVGAPLYERAGFVAADGHDRVWAARASGELDDGVDRVFAEGEVAAELARTSPPASESYAVWPTAGQLDWHLERERIYADLLHEPRARVHGARRGESVAFWSGDLKNSVLRIELLVAASTEDAMELIRAARRAAHDAGLREVRHWAQPTDPPWPEGEDGGRREAREGALSMLAPLDDRVDPHAWRVIPRALWI